MKYRLVFALLLTIWLAGGNAAAQSGITINGSVYGGGNLADVGGSVTVNMRTGTVVKDVYGGGALANTNNCDPNDYEEVSVTVGMTVVTGYYTKSGNSYTEITQANQKAVSGTTYYKKGKWVIVVTTNKTEVNLLGGTIKGNVYGGGLGRQAVEGKEAVGTEGEPGYVPAVEAVTGVAAIVYGNVTVTLDGTKMVSHFTGEGNDRMADAGQIFGCNNLNGTPKGHVKVHVKRTVDSDKSSEAALALTRDQRTTYDVAAVYGGGNQANYEPIDAFLDPAVEGNPAKIAAAFAEVLIEGCDATSIEHVYGGGNAAAVPATEVTVKGTYIIDYLFGGGNGKSTSTYTNPGADVGIIDKTAHAANPSNGNYGTGKAVTKLIGGKIHVVFGGSNTLGNVRGGTEVSMPESDGTGDCCTKLDVREIYGAGQNAGQEGGVNLILGCVEGLQNVYGGARNANIAGGVNLTVTSGKFENVFGGNDVAGTIQGPITLNIEETACDPIIINNLYLGGNEAAYSIYGYYDDNGTLKPRTATDTEEARPHVGSTAVPYANPVLNVISCTRIDNVFGGGYGATAVMYGSPTVNINMIPGDHASSITRATSATDSDTKKAHYLGAIGNVFGGGNLAAVVGNTTVNIGQSEYVEMTSYDKTDVRDYYTRTGSAGSYTYTLVGGDNAVAATPGTSYYKKVEGAYITGSVYGGGNQANVTGNTAVNVCAVNSDDPSTTGVVEFTAVSISGTNFEGVIIEGAVFGAGKGVNTSVSAALVSGNTIVGMAGGEVKKSVYGGGELSQVGGDTFVTITSGTIGTSGQGGATYGNVYGGGLGSTDDIRFGLIKGNTYVNINSIVADAAYHEAHTDVAVGTVLSSPTILHNIYGGGAYGSVGTFTYASDAADAVISGLQTANTGITNVTVTGGTIGTTGQNNGMVFGSSRGDVGAPNAIHDRLAWVYDTHVTIGTSGQGTVLTTPTIKGSVYGGGENGHNYNDAEVIVHSGTIGIHDGTAADATRGNVYGGGCGTDKYYSSSYTGTITNPTDGNGDTYNPLAGIVYGDATITMTGGLVNHNVYGAGAMGSVGTFTKDNADVITFTSGGTTTVAISGGTVGVDGDENGNVFGAARGDKAFTDKDLSLVNETDVTISGSTTIVKGNVYGGGEVGNVHTNTKVDVLGGTIAMNVFGGGKGVEDLFTCEQAMVGAEGDGACQDPDDEDNIDKGTIVTISNGTVGTLDANNNNQLVVGTGNVYGGGEIGRVEWNTQVTIGDAAGTNTPYIYGSVFGAGKGLETHGYSALVRGNSTVTVQGKAKVGHNVYGGGEKSTVGRYWVKDIPATPCNANETQPTAPAGLPTGMPYQQRSGGKCRVYIQGSADIGYNGAAIDKGHVFGAGKGVEPHFTAGTTERMVNNNGGSMQAFEDEKDQTGKVVKTAEELYLEFLQTLALVTNAYVTIDGSAKVKGNVYGGSESGFVQHDTNVTILSSNCEIGTVSGTTSSYGNVFGGGKGLEEFAEAGKVKGNTTVDISNGTMNGNVYGGGELGDVGIIDKTATDKDGILSYNYAWKQTDGTTANTPHNNVPSDTSHDTSKNTGICTVTITGGTIGSASASTANHASGHVFGAGRGSSSTWWCEKAIAFATNVSVSGSTVVYGTVYGGGQVGRVEDDARVIIGTANDPGSGSKPDIRGDVFGAGAGLETHGYSALLRGNAKVTVQGIAKVGGNVYGGGETASVGKFTVVGGLPSKPDTGGTCTVTIQDGATIGASGTSNHVFGACKGVNPATITDRKSMQLYTNRPKDASGNYKPETDGSWSFYPSNHDFVWVYYTENEYPAFLRTLALTSNTNVTIDENSTINGSVYGGGERGVTLGTVVVNMNGGTVKQDVYGGGALADTNKGNWDVHTYVEVSVSSGVSVAGLYTRTGSGTDSDPYVYTEIGEGVTAVSNGTYYRQGTWATDQKSALYTTTVNLIGGEIHGDAYGGGLGQRDGFYDKSGDIAALVYGDVNVVLGTAKNVTPASATAFNITHYDNAPGTAYDESTIIKSGRVFGCNNLNGSPKGDVTVRVWRTVTGTLNGSTNTRTAEAKKKLKEGDDGYVPHTYEVAAVYGGGNLANYTTPEAGKKAHVIIETCDVSIETVYGGGNAAEVPGTDVQVKGAYEINEVFGGGNGSDPYTTNDDATNWVENRGANIGNATQAGTAKTVLSGGLIHAAYGASNKKGTVYGSVSIDIGTDGDCTLDLEKMVGAGKDADVNGDLIMVLGCKPNTEIPVVYGGADNAHVNGNVELTITSGIYNNVFGGNNAGGYILGHIKLNIEEQDCDTPIRINHLYLGGREAAYSMYGYYNAGTAEAPNPQPRTAEMTVAGTNYKAPLTDINGMTVRRQPDTTTQSYAQPELNIISCTYIGEVFGGGYGEGATIYGDPIVNINMVPGPNAATNITRDGGNNAHALGEIGDVFGGGNQAAVEGSTTVNIGQLKYVEMTSYDEYDVRGYYTRSENAGNYTYNQVTGDAAVAATTNTSYYKKVEGAYITGNVYGGGNLADVTGNTFVNICAKYDSETKKYVAVDEGTEGVTIGGTVYGGGRGQEDTFLCEKAMIGENGLGADNPDYPNGNTSVRIGHGTVNGSVYGGGQVGRVEMNTVVEIGFGDGGSGSKSPVIEGYVFGAGAGVKTHGYSALVRGNTNVTIAGNTWVKKSVYGGGEIASVARYRVAQSDEEGAPYGVEKGEPYLLENPNSGYCYVTVQGHAEIGTNGMKMYHIENGTISADDKPDDWGHVFAAGKGVLPDTYNFDNFSAADRKNYPKRMALYDSEKYKSTEEEVTWEYVDPAHKETNKNIWEYFNTEAKYFTFIQTLGLATQTEATIDGNALVNGSVYGGSENGLVQFDTNVTIDGDCQIGVAEGEGKPDCAHWEFKAPYEPYDPYAKYLNDGEGGDGLYYYDEDHSKSAAGGAKIATDGHTYYGNVFGGGSGSVPYFNTLEGKSEYLSNAGTVKGNTYVIISGGHILTNVYGGCEATNVLGTANVTMTAGTVGVERTDEQIIALPLTGYIFGGGKGDQRIFFNKETNVNHSIVKVEGGRIYGSVYGGGEDGHVLGNVTMTIGKTGDTGPMIGTQGTSYYDGNVFGGGRGFGGEALTAGNVGGAVTLDILGGQILGSVYGGGRLASVGYGLYLSTGDEAANYGKMRADDEYDGSYPNPSTEDASVFYNKGRGKISVTVSGGTIGNDVENAEYGGNVFGGSMGRLTKLDGSAFDSADHWSLLATAKKTTVNVTGGTIKRSVYGGGEIGTVTTDAIVNVSGGIIGTLGKGAAEYGNVYGGGKGYVDPAGSDYITAGIIKGNSAVTISNTLADAAYAGAHEGVSVGDPIGGPTIYHNVYGGGAYGSLGTFTYYGESSEYSTNYNKYKPGGSEANATKLAELVARKYEITGYTSGGKADVIITGGTIGTNGKENGMVFGSSRGDVDRPGAIQDRLAWVYDTHVVIGTSGQGTTISTPLIKGSVYGSGENGHTYQNTIVDVHSGTIGIASGGDITDNNGTPNDEEDDITYSGAEYPYRGNVYGGGCGTDKYYDDPTGIANPYDGNGDTFNPLAGIVYGTATVNIDGGLVVHNVYGAGAMGSVGNTDNSGAFTSGGKTTIAISGGTVGVNGTVDDGNVYGAARGDLISTQTGLSYVRITDVTISGSTKIKGNVYGGGQAGDVGTYTTAEGTNTYIYHEGCGNCQVTVTGGEISGHVFGAGEGSANSFECLKAMVNSTSVSISNGTVHGNVYGGGEIGRVENDAVVTVGRKSGEEEGAGTGTPTINGSVFGGGAGVETHGYSALVRGSTTVSIEGGTGAKVLGSVYGGGEIASVGRYGLDAQKMPNILLGGGVCTVTVKGKVTIGPANASADYGNVFGAGKGVDPHYVYGTSDKGKWSRRMVTYDYDDSKEEGKKGRHTPGSEGKYWDPYDDPNNPYDDPNNPVYVWEYFCDKVENTDNYVANESKYTSYLETLALVTAPDVTIGNSGTTDTPKINGNVFGGGELGFTKGSVIVKIQGGTIEKDVYGGGSLANTNTTHDVGEIDGETGAPVKDGDNYVTHEVHPTTIVKLLGGYIKGDAYGGGLGRLGEHFTSADISAAVAGDAAYGKTVDDWKVTEVEARVIGNVLVDLNGETTVTTGSDGGKTWGNTGSTISSSSTGCIVNRVFGCNNKNGSPRKDVTVHVYATQNKNVTNKATITKKYVSDKDIEATLERETPTDDDLLAEYVTELKAILADEIKVAETISVPTTNSSDESEDYKDLLTDGDANVSHLKSAIEDLISSINNAIDEEGKTEEQKAAIALLKADINDLRYDVKAVYGGGNEAAYIPDTSTGATDYKSHVIIDGCGYTSIETVYGGGNAAATPATHVEVNSCYEIGTVFGGGNGKDNIIVNGVPTANPGADVGYKPNDEGGKDSYGTGIALAELHGGTIHSAFGGSNTKGNVRTSATVTLNEPDGNTCPLCIEEVYGAGNEADQDGTSNIDLGCLSYLSEIYGGAKNADVNSNVELTIQSGRFNRVFGGNNLGGVIRGTITVNIEETGCHPIVIGQLFGGGNQAAYTAPPGQPGPTVNVKSFTSIGEIYGGGFGNSAVVTGNTYININEYKGKYADEEATENFIDENGNPVTENDVPVKVSENTGKWIHFVADASNSNNIATVWQPEHREGAIGTIGNVFGGGNEAGVTGSTNVRIGNMSYVPIASVVAGTTDVRGYYTRSGEGTKESPYEYAQITAVPVLAEAGVTYCEQNVNVESNVPVAVEVGVTDVSNYFIRTGAGTGESPYVYTPVTVPPVLAVGGTTYYKAVLGANITGNVYGGGNAANVSGDTNVVIGREVTTP